MNLKNSVEIFWMGQTNTAWKQENICQKTTYNKHVLQQWRWIVFGAPSQHRIKHQKQKTLTPGLHFIFFVGSSRVPFYTQKPGSASALVDPTKPANTFGQGNPPNKNIFYIKTCKTNTTKCNLSAASVLRFKGVHVNSLVLIAHLICVHGCSCVCVCCNRAPSKVT